MVWCSAVSYSPAHFGCGVPSALVGLTSGFGMGPGVSRTAIATVTTNHLSVLCCCVWSVCGSCPCVWGWVGLFSGFCIAGAGWSAACCGWVCVGGKSFGVLVPVHLARYRVCMSGLSAQWSAGCLNPRGGGRVHLEVGFPLRCFQRLSRPDVANQPCPWRDNWHTRGPSVPVLSY